MLTVDTSNLNIVLVSNGVELFLLFHELGEVDMHRSSEGGTKIGRARGDVSEMLILSELAILLDGLSGSAKSIEDFFDTSSFLHRDDSELIFLIDPDEERLGVVVENTTTGRPVSVEVASLKESISFLEEEVIIDELLLDGGVHTLERVESTLEISVEIGSSLNDGVHNLKSLCLGNTWTKRISSEIPADTDTSGVYHSSFIGGEISVLETLGGHISNVLISFLVTVIFFDNSIKKLFELSV